MAIMGAENDTQMADGTSEEVERFSKFLSAAQSGDSDLFWAAALQLGDDAHEIKEEERGRTALHFAAQAGHLQLCRYLLDNLKFNVNAQDKNGDTALSLAAAAGQEEVVDLLLQRGADPKLFKGAGPLHRAAGAGSAGVVRRLLRAGADPNAPGESGPPLFWAAGSKHADVVALLLRAGADPNKLSQQGMTPLAMAAAIGCVPVVRMLLAAGAKAGAAVAGGFTALHIAAESGNMEVVELLLQAGAQPDVADEQGKTPLRVAAEVGHKEVVTLLARCALGAAADAEDAEDAELSGGSGEEEEEDIEVEEAESEGDESEAAPAEAAGSSAGAAGGQPGGSGGEGGAAATVAAAAEPGGSNEGVAEMFRQKATEFFVAGDYAGAVRLYSLAIQHCPRSPLLWGNRAAAQLKLGEAEQALQDARAARRLEPSYAKGWWREGQAAAALGRWAEALAAYTALEKLRPGCEEVVKLLQEAREQAGGAAVMAGTPAAS